MLRLWLLAYDVTSRLGLSRAALYCIERAGALTDSGVGADCRERGAVRHH